MSSKIFSIAAERHPIGRGDVLMDQQTLHNLRKRAIVARKRSNRAAWGPGSLMAFGLLN